MRLRTEIHTRTPDTPNEVDFSGADHDFIHDAAAAHALLVAINENMADWLSCPDDHPAKVSSWLLKRADEIMASWGYGED